MIFNCWRQVLRNLCPPGANSQGHLYLRRLHVSRSCSGMPASSSPLVSIGCLCLVPRVPPNLMSNHGRAYPSHIPSCLPPTANGVRFAHYNSCFTNQGCSFSNHSSNFLYLKPPVPFLVHFKSYPWASPSSYYASSRKLPLMPCSPGVLSCKCVVGMVAHDSVLVIIL